MSGTLVQNVDPIYTHEGNIGFSSGYMTAANATTDLTAGTSYLIFTSDATAGSFVQRIRFKVTPSGSASTATVARVWINNGATTGTATNNVLFDEMTLPATTATTTAAGTSFDLWCNFVMPAGYKLYVTLGAASAQGWAAVVIGGNY